MVDGVVDTDCGDLLVEDTDAPRTMRRAAHLYLLPILLLLEQDNSIQLVYSGRSSERMALTFSSTTAACSA